jgi:hypothetical protein
MGACCPNCSLWADGYDGGYHHLVDRAAFVASSPDPPDAQPAFARSRGWRFPMVSHIGTTIAADMGYRSEHGGWLPVFAFSAWMALASCAYRIRRATSAMNSAPCRISSICFPKARKVGDRKSGIEGRSTAHCATRSRVALLLRSALAGLAQPTFVIGSAIGRIGADKTTRPV